MVNSLISRLRLQSSPSKPRNDFECCTGSFKPLWPKTTQNWLHKPLFIMRGVLFCVAFWLLLICMYAITSLYYHLPSFQPPHSRFRGPISQTSSLCLRSLCHALHSVGTTSNLEYAPLVPQSLTAIDPPTGTAFAMAYGSSLLLMAPEWIWLAAWKLEQWLITT